MHLKTISCFDLHVEEKVKEKNAIDMVKSIYSEKATKFCEISTNYLTDIT